MCTKLAKRLSYDDWWRGRDSNPRSSGYEPLEMTNFSTPLYLRTAAAARIKKGSKTVPPRTIV